MRWALGRSIAFGSSINADEHPAASKERSMSRIVTFTSVTLDGVMQAPGRPDEDRRGGFEHGGWATPYQDPVLAAEAGKGMAKGGALLFGRRTYEDFFSVWPSMPQPNPFTDVLNNTHKYLASRTLHEPPPWQNSTLLGGNIPQAIAGLKEQVDGDVTILGSGELVRSLMPHGLIDEYVLLIHPLVLGSGRRLFPDQGTVAKLRLIEAKPTTTGVIIATYQPA
jgi:dihydrofolate reductase